MGVTSEQWGQKVAAVVVLNPAHAQTGKGGKTWGVMDMRRALKDKLANYKIPQELKAIEGIPKNAMGKSMYFYSPSLLVHSDGFEKSTRKAWSRRYSGIKHNSAAPPKRVTTFTSCIISTIMHRPRILSRASYGLVAVLIPSYHIAPSTPPLAGPWN